MKLQKVSFAHFVIFGITIFLFWGLRVLYWSTTTELPFSDMANFDSTARGVATSWNYDWSPFWRTYTTPTLVTVRAIQIVLFGDGMFAWQMFQAVITFVSAVWLCYELLRATKAKWLALAFLITVSISKSSIFWSLKLSREGLQEAFIYAQIAGFLFAYQKRSLFSFFVLGLITSAAFLNRGNAIFIVPFLVLMIFIMFACNRQAFINLFFSAIGTFFLGVLMLWSPWVMRSLIIYGEPVFLSTQGPYSFLWELGMVSVKLDDGTQIDTDVAGLQKNAMVDFPNDLAASKYADSIFRAWLKENWRDFHELVLFRIHSTVLDRQIDLTKVDRDRLFHNSLENHLLLDKNVFLVYAGAVGVFLLPFLYRQWALTCISFITLVPWLSGAVWISDGRMLEPSLPILLFSNIVWVVLLGMGLRLVFPMFRKIYS
jgi:hypothetical protein